MRKYDFATLQPDDIVVLRRSSNDLADLGLMEAGGDSAWD